MKIDEYAPHAIPIIRGSANSLTEGMKIYTQTIVIRVVKTVFIDLVIVWDILISVPAFLLL